MFRTIRNAFAIPDLRKKLLYTLLIIMIFRIGSGIPVPFLEADVLKNFLAANASSGNFLSYLNVLTGGAFGNATIFAMSITPYINASIIIQLLTVAIPPLEKLSKEGEEGRKKLGKITRYTTLVLGLIQGIGLYLVLRNKEGAVVYTTGFSGIFSMIVILATFTAGTGLIVWLGERINEKGIGNGISMILFAGIVSRAPDAIFMMVDWFQLALAGQFMYYIWIPVVIVLFIAMVAIIVIMNNAERRIPVQYAKRVVGRKMYGGQSSHIPIKVSMSGVMPIIFATSIVSIPSMIEMFLPSNYTGWFRSFTSAFHYTSVTYMIVTFLLIIGFNYFYVSIQYNPIEIANNLQKNNGTIPGIRPGKSTSDFITRVISKITLLGAVILGLIAIFPMVLSGALHQNIALGGTTIIILVGVALDTMRSLESQMMVRHHKGFLE